MRNVWAAVMRGDWKIEGGRVALSFKTPQEAAAATNELRSAGMLARWAVDQEATVYVLEERGRALNRMRENAPEEVAFALQGRAAV